MNETNIVKQLLDIAPLQEDSLDLDMGYCSARIQSNSVELLSTLRDYFSFIVRPVTEPTFTVQAIETDEIDLGLNFVGWQREPGKSGRKDSTFDLDGARLVRKVRTGMVFLQSLNNRLAVGPCLKNDNQVINFITSQMMSYLQQRDWLICHSAAIVRNNQTYAVAGFSGGGKSSLMLTMLENDESCFLSNDRLFIKANENQVDAAGVPKMPRINPGTIVHNERLHALIPESKRNQLLAMPHDDLWQLEDKFDADIQRFYGDNRISYQAPLKALLILNWSRTSTKPVELNRVTLNERPELLKAVMKSSGPFYQNVSGEFITDNDQTNPQVYLDVLDQVQIYEASGGVDFEKLAELYSAIQ